MKLKSSILSLIMAGVATVAVANPFEKTECIAPAKPGGGFDLTCKLAQSALMERGTMDRTRATV